MDGPCAARRRCHVAACLAAQRAQRTMPAIAAATAAAMPLQAS
jgi:hypothetical protein